MANGAYAVNANTGGVDGVSEIAKILTLTTTSQKQHIIKREAVIVYISNEKQLRERHKHDALICIDPLTRPAIAHT